MNFRGNIKYPLYLATKRQLNGEKRSNMTWRAKPPINFWFSYIVFLSRGELLNRLSVFTPSHIIVQELCESRGGRPGLSVLTSLLVSVDV